MSALPVLTPTTERRTVAEIICDLSKFIPSRLLREKTVGRGNSARQVQYLPWHIAVKFLDLYAPGWSYEIREVKQVGDLCVVVARITIHASDGCVWREATGSEPLDTDTWGDPTSNAESMALRRAAAKLGLGLYLYEHAR